MCYEIHFNGYDSHYTQVKTIYYITVSIASLPAYNLVESTISYYLTAEKEGVKYGGIYKRIVRGYCNGSLLDGIRFIKTTLWFFNGCTNFDKKDYHFKKVGHDCFTMHIYSLIHQS